MRLYKSVCPILLVAMLLPVYVTTVSANPSNDEIPAENKWGLICLSTAFLYQLNYPEAAWGGCQIDYGSMGVPPGPEADALAWEWATWFRDILINDYGWLLDHFTILTNADNTKANVIQAIKDLKQHDSPNSMFVMIFGGHGWVVKDTDGDETSYPPMPGTTRKGVDPWDECWMAYDSIPSGQGNPDNMATFIKDDEFKVLFDELDFQGRLFVDFCPACCGGGLIEDIAAPNRIAIGVGNADRLEMSIYAIYWYPWYALMGCSGAEFLSMMNLNLNPDANGDGKISVEEAYSWAVAANEATLPTYFGPGEGPDNIYIVDGIVGETFL